MLFYGGQIDGLLDNISIESLDIIIDLIDEYIDLVEAISDARRSDCSSRGN